MLTRGQFLRVAGGSAVGLLVARGGVADALAREGVAGAVAHERVVGAHETAAPSDQSFYSRPDLRPPSLNLRYTGTAPPASEGYLFVGPTAKPEAQAGLLIVDPSGQPVWFAPAPPGWWVSNFRVQQYRGQPVLAWWEGKVRPPGYGFGQGVLMNSAYQRIAVVRARRGRQADLHEFLLTPEGTALITCHPRTVPADLSAVGGPSNGAVLESIIQEIDVANGELLFEWRSLEHVGIAESYLPPNGLYDYLHVNSIDLTADGHLLVSGRHTCALYKVHRRTGRVLWRLGGRRSHFSVGRRARFHWQHDARHLPGGLITVFDNGAGPVKTETQSRALVLHVDLVGRTVRLAEAYRHPDPVLSAAMGNVQVLPDANVMVGYGLVPLISEYAPDGQLLGQLWLPWGYNCYRGYRLPWAGAPLDQPAIAVAPGASSGTPTLYASWNGATAVASWQLNAGPSPTALQPAGITPRSGFETAIPLSSTEGYAAVTALDASGNALASSAAISV